MIEHAALELEKLAFDWTPAKARAVEAAAGVGVGGALGGFAGHSTYTPEKATHRVDPGGWLAVRDLSDKEKKNRLDRTVKGALGGAVVGAGGSLGISKGIRHLLDMADEEVLKRALKEQLPPREQMLAQIKHEQQTDLVETAGRVMRPEEGVNLLERLQSAIARRSKSIDVAEKMLRDEGSRIEGLAAKAKGYREARPWGHIPEVIDPNYPLGHEKRKVGKDPAGSVGGLLGLETGREKGEGAKRTALLRFYQDRLKRLVDKTDGT